MPRLSQSRGLDRSAERRIHLSPNAGRSISASVGAWPAHSASRALGGARLVPSGGKGASCRRHRVQAVPRTSHRRAGATVFQHRHSVFGGPPGASGPSPARHPRHRGRFPAHARNASPIACPPPASAGSSIWSKVAALANRPKRGNCKMMALHSPREMHKVRPVHPCGFIVPEERKQ